MVSIVLGMSFGLCSISQAQTGGMGGGMGGMMGGGMGGGMPTIPGTQFDEATDPSSLRAVNGLRIVPSIQVSERYDSNVFFAPKSRLQGLNPADFVTTAMPQVRGLYAHPETLVKANATVGAVGSYYANNTGLSYVGTNGGAVLDMSDWLSQWRPGTRWTVSDTFFYSPQPPAFLLGGRFGEQINPLLAGFQAPRTNTTFNSINTTFQLPLNKTVSLSGSYTNSRIHYGASQVPQAVNLISQNVHTYYAGLLKQVSLQDTVRADFTGNEFDLGRVGVFNTRGGTLGWSHLVSPAVSIDVSGGAQLLSGQLNGASFSSIAPFGSLAVFWKDPTTSIMLTYRSGITPSFQFQGAAMLNHTVSFTMTQNTPIRDLVCLLGANYSIANEFGSNSPAALSWTTVGGTGGLLYRVAPKTFLTFNYSYLNVDNAFGERHLAYDKHMVQLSLAQAFY